MLSRISRRLAALLGLSTVWLLLLCVPALAHAELVETYPAEGAALVEPPEQVQLRFSEPVEAEFSPLKVYDQQDSRVDEDDARVSPNDATLVVIDLEELPEGSYNVEWRVTSVDGHTIDGEYGFAVDASAGTGEEGVGEPIAPIERATEQEEAGSTGDNTQIIALALLFVGALVATGLVLRQRKRSP